MSDPPDPRRPFVSGEPIPPDSRPLSAEDDPTSLRVPASRRNEAIVAALLGVAGLAGAGFVVAYVVSNSTAALGATLGAALLLLGAALIVAGKGVVPQEVVLEPRHSVEHPEEQRETAELIRFGAQGVSRRRLLTAAAGVAAAGIGAAVAATLTSLGPWVGGVSVRSPWRRGLTLVDARGRPIRAADLEIGSFLTAFPQGANMDDLGAALMVVRIDPGRVRLPAGRRGWAPGGILAYSKICTHAGCAVSMFRSPLFPAHTASPALVCPCHYSTFDVATGGTVLFGPAGRPLPELPLAIASDGTLRAAGSLSGDVGPAWFGVNRG